MTTIALLGIAVLLTAPAGIIAVTTINMWRRQNRDDAIKLLLRAGLAAFLTTGSAAVLATAILFIAQATGHFKLTALSAGIIPILSTWGITGIISIFTGFVLKFDAWQV